MAGVNNMIRRICKIVLNEQGATAVEYGLILAMIVLAMLAALSSFAQEAINKWNYVSEQVLTA